VKGNETMEGGKDVLTESQARELIREALPLAALVPVIKKVAVVAGPRLAAALVRSAPKLAGGGKRAVAFARKHPRVVSHLVNHVLSAALEKASGNPDLMKHAEVLGLVGTDGLPKKIDASTITASLESARGASEQSWGEVLKQMGSALSENEEELLRSVKESTARRTVNETGDRDYKRIVMSESSLRGLVLSLLREPS
jgi:hypothetical protein